MSTSQPISPTDVSGGDKQRLVSLERLVKRLHFTNAIAITILSLVTVLVVAAFLTIIVYLIIQGLPYLLKPDFYSADRHVEISVLPQIFNTLYVLVLAEIFLVPISLAAAIYLTEYARQGLFVTVVHFAAETLASVPSLVLGLFGYIVFASLLHFGYSRLSGALALLCLNLPQALRLFEAALTSVPREMREGGLALGSTKWHMIRTVVLPSALPGIITGIVLSAGKILAESAVLVFTMGTTSNIRHVFNLDPLQTSDTLTVHIWYVKTIGSGTFSTPGAENIIAAGSAALLIVLLLIINVGARALGRLIEKRITAA